MKLSAPLILALGSFAGLSAANDAQACQKKNGNLMTAIQNFCANSNIRVPSNYAKNGVKSPDKRSEVWITTASDACPVNSWVPQNICQDQFHSMCATGGKHGAKNQYYSSGGGCIQQWHIYYSNIPMLT